MAKDVTVDDLIAEIGRLHIQVMALQKEIAELKTDFAFKGMGEAHGVQDGRPATDSKS